MKKIVVLSDTHGNYSALEKLLPIMQESDYVFHLGDYQKDILSYQKELGNKIISVKGNCDGGGNDQLLEIEGVKIFLTHGDRYSVKSDLFRLEYKAKEVRASLVFYGHTHCAGVYESDSITYVNPGCLNGFLERSYCYAVIHDGKFVLKNVKVR